MTNFGRLLQTKTETYHIEGTEKTENPEDAFSIIFSCTGGILIKKDRENNFIKLHFNQTALLLPKQKAIIKSQGTTASLTVIHYYDEFSEKNSPPEHPIYEATTKAMKLMEAAAMPNEHGLETTATGLIANALLNILIEHKRYSANEENDKQNATVRNAVSFIESNINKEINVQKIADYCGVTVQHLSRLFKQLGYPSPMKYFWEQRIKQGLQMLVSTDKAVKQIAEFCGFKTTHHFSNKVKETTGMAPKDYRNKYGNLASAKKTK